MKRIVSVLLAVVACLVFPGCGGNIENAAVEEWEPSEFYSDEEIGEAIGTVKKYFQKEFSGCTLTRIGYAGDDAEEFGEWEKQYGVDEVIVLYSSFEVDSSGGDGSLEPNSTYDDWEWILGRDKGGAWRHLDHGYG